jgi:hypothetical protein
MTESKDRAAPNAQVQAVLYRLSMAEHHDKQADAQARICRDFEFGHALGVRGCYDHVRAKNYLHEHWRLARVWRAEAEQYAEGL